MDQALSGSSLQVSARRQPLSAWHALLAIILALTVSACTTRAGDAAAGAAAHIQFDEIRSHRYRRLDLARVLYQTAAEAPRFPASLTKMMTLYLLFEAMESGRVTMTTQIPVSDYARSRPPTKIGFKRGDTIDVETAILAVVTKSANDVAVAIGEYLGGSEDNFAAMMTAKARQIGMRSTTFRNASGLPDAGQITTARDMALLGVALRKRFPQYFRLLLDQEFQLSRPDDPRPQRTDRRRRRRRRHQDGLYACVGLQCRHLGVARRPQAGGGGDGRRQRAQPQRQHGRADRTLHAERRLLAFEALADASAKKRLVRTASHASAGPVQAGTRSSDG